VLARRTRYRREVGREEGKSGANVARISSLWWSSRGTA
jgi:hypothetical protein